MSIVTRVKCIDIPSWAGHLTVGKEYKTVAENSNEYLINNDVGNATWYSMDIFITVPQLTPHQHAHAIHAYADGYAIEMRGRGNGWSINTTPMFSPNFDYRVAKIVDEEAILETEHQITTARMGIEAAAKLITELKHRLKQQRKGTNYVKP